MPYREPFKTNYSFDYGGPKPTLALLAINKRIRDEALPVFYGQNVWRITGVKGNYHNDMDILPSDTIWRRHGSHIRHVDLYYLYRSVDTQVALNTTIGHL